MEARKIVLRPVVTEKTSNLRAAENKYVFEVATDANKIQIKAAVEEIFKVHVEKITTWYARGKLRRRGRFVGKTPDRKRAAVTVRKGESIPVFEQV
ncbi:MAG: 50S ribosomal protein L23 [Candidatus Eisenbacteria bacterium]|jgi:large subunit ribosomal protein L23|nr:50S ribosomal protein L23 [Candidatus Eisenbacteria bacterium]